MATPIYVPRINNNDDEVKILAFDVSVGDKIENGQIVGQVETDKAVLDVTASSSGYVIGFVAKIEEVVKVGSVMLWIGKSRDEAIPECQDMTSAETPTQGSKVTAKARLLLEKSGLQAAAIPSIDGRVTVEAVENYLALQGAKRSDSVTSARTHYVEALPEVEGTYADLTREEKGMAVTVAWHRDFAVPGYIEIEYDAAPWIEYAKQFQEKHGLLMPPLLPLMAWRLVQIACASPRLNATIVSNKRFEYSGVNLGFTVQTGESLYLAVVRNAQDQEELAFVNSLGNVLRRAAGHNLKEPEATGATIGFSSMERWKVSRHIPILSPQTSIMVGHAVGTSGRSVIGASYDHRVLNGGQVVAMLRKLSTPNKT